MDRRAALRTLAAAGAAALAGCSAAAPGDAGARGGDADDAPGDGTAPPTAAGGRTTDRGADRPATGAGTDAATVTELPVASLGIPADVCEEEIRSAPGIYAVTEPAAAADWSGHEIDPVYRPPGKPGGPEGGVDPDQPVVGVAAGGRARAYPLSVLTVHEVVNDDVGGPVVVTYCPLCRSGLVADRRLGGAATTFGVTGLLWKAPSEYTAGSELNGDVFGVDPAGATGVRNNGNLVMYDRATRSYWSQILAEAICGPRRGTALSIRPSTVTTWAEWRETHPATDVLLPPPHSVTEEPPIG
jgi:hypothetical protein